MANKQTIKYLYKNIRRPKNGLPGNLLAEVEECCRERFNIKFDNGFMTIGTLDECNLFRNIRLSSINGFRIAGNEVAMVTDRSILFFDISTGNISVNIREPEESLFQRFANRIKSIYPHHSAKPCLE